MRPLVVGVALVTALLGSCSAESAPEAGTIAGCPAGVVVDSSAEIEDALSSAEPGDVIAVEPGRYEGNFVADRSADADRPIVLCGSAKAILDGGTTDKGYTLHLDGVSHWEVRGLTVTGGAKGVMLDGSSDNRLLGVSVSGTGEEAVHLRTGSSRNLLRGLRIKDAGLTSAKRGEGIYVGSAESNWCDLTDCEPDRSDDNRLVRNRIQGTTAEAIDVKEGTSSGVLEDNRLDGKGAEDADSLIDVKGNGWTISGTVGTHAPGHGAAVFEILDGWGEGNVFEDNSFAIPSSGWAVEIFGDAREGGNRVDCSNTALVGGAAAPDRVSPDGCTS